MPCIDSIVRGHAGCWAESAGAWACAQLLQADRSRPTLQCIRIWCMHAALLRTLTLDQRALSLDRCKAPSAALAAFLHKLCRLLYAAAEQLRGSTAVGHLDVLDGRLMHVLAAAEAAGTCSVEPSVGIAADQLQAEIYAQAGMPAPAAIPITRSTAFATCTQLADSPAGSSDSSSDTTASEASADSMQLLMPIQDNLLIDSYLNSSDLQGIQTLPPDHPAALRPSVRAQLFAENFHWHCHKPLEPSYLAQTARQLSPEDKEWAVKSERLQARAVKREQLQARHIRNYAISLQGSKYAPPALTSAPQKQSRGRAASSSKPKAETKADTIKRENSAKAAEKLRVTKLQQWQQLEKQWDKQAWSDSLAKQVDSLTARFGDVPSLQPDLLAYKLQRLLQHYKQSFKSAASPIQQLDTNSSSPHMQTAITLWQTCSAIVSHKHMPHDHAAIKAAAGTMQTLGFAAAARTLLDGTASNKPAKSASQHSSSRAAADRKHALGLSEARFQLQHCGHLLHQDEPAERDPRVQTFNPDAWQREVQLKTLSVQHL